jgi:Transposase DDE domain
MSSIAALKAASLPVASRRSLRGFTRRQYQTHDGSLVAALPFDLAAERRASEIMFKAKSKAAGCRITAGADKAYDTADHVANLRASNVTPHVTQNNSITKTGKSRQSAIDERTTRHEGYGMSQSRRAMIECIFGWGKQHGTMRKTKHRGILRVAADFMLNLIAYNLIRIPKLIAA